MVPQAGFPHGSNGQVRAINALFPVSLEASSVAGASSSEGVMAGEKRISPSSVRALQFESFE